MKTNNLQTFCFREAHLAHLHPIADRLYETGRFERLGLFFDFLSEKEKEWTERGDSDGFFVYHLVQGYAQRAIAAGSTDPTSFLLNYQAMHFDGDFADEAQERELDYSFGLAQRPAIYYSKGCTVEFGSRPAEAGTPLSWTVLAQEESRVLLLADHGIDFRPFHDASQDVTWSDCSLREWLNTDFFDQAFSPAEQERIPAVPVHTPDNLRFNVKGGPDTVDHIFLLSTEEADTLIPDVHSRIRKAAPSAIAAGALCDAEGRTSWLLRSPGSKWLSTACVCADGRIDTAGPYVHQAQCCVCPALWMNLSVEDDFWI